MEATFYPCQKKPPHGRCPGPQALTVLPPRFPQCPLNLRVRSCYRHPNRACTPHGHLPLCILTSCLSQHRSPSAAKGNFDEMREPRFSLSIKMSLEEGAGDYAILVVRQ